MKYDDLYKEKNERMKYFFESSKLTSSVMTAIGSNMLKGNLELKQKEYIMLGIAIAIRCQDCILAHVKNCKDLGATEQEIREVAECAVAMGGSPSYAYGSLALDIYKNI
ncbi:MAG: carboxymuconolactone decarboxylase family protein [Lagierella massiliensis]|nr:carboxymuconolactone decarboxylase family protein [Lagierella massiliensis]